MEAKKKTSKKEEEERLHQFRNDFRNSSKFSNTIDILIEYADDEVFSNILNLKEAQYLDSINSYLKNKLNEIYTESIFDNNSLNNLISNKIEKIKKNYNLNFKLLNDAYEYFNNLPKKNLTDYYLTDFRKHCCDTQEYCLHSCHSRFKNNLLVVKENKKFLICLSCKKVFLNSFIDGYCNSCSVEYKTSILNKNENKMLLLATWKKYHCEEIINEKIKCIKCTKFLYLNFKTQNLDCLNCEFSAKPNRILWTCNIDKVEFKSDAIVYNPLQVQIVKKSINLTLMIKHKAHPNNLSCCPKINVYFQEFYHKKECKGVLFLGELRNKIIIVCEKCKSINFYERFIWTCPNCGRRFRDRKSNFRTYKDLVNNDRANTIEEDNNIKEEETEDKKEKSYRERLKERRERIHNEIKNDNNEDDDMKLNKSTNFGRHVRRSFINVNKSVDQLYGKDDDDSNDSSHNRYHRLFKHQTQNVDEDDSKIKSHISGRYKNTYRTVNTEIDDEDEEGHKKFPASTRNKRFSYFFLEKEKENKRKKELDEKEKEREKEKEKEEREKEREKRREQREKERKEREEREEKEREKEREREKRREEREKEREREKRREEREKEREREKDDKTHINYQKRYKIREKEENEEQNNKEKERQLRRDRIEKERQEQKEKEEKLRIEREQRERARKERIERRKEESNNNNENDTKPNRHFFHRHTTGDRDNNPSTKNNNEISNNNPKEKPNKKYNKIHTTEDDSESKTRANTHSPHGGNSLPKEIIKILNEGIIPQINIDDYTILSQVGEGSYGVIYKVKNNHNKQIFALKKEIAHDEFEVQLIYEDVKLINSCNHNNVMKIYGITVCPLDVTTFAIYILMEYADDDWDKEIKKNYQNRINYKEDELINILKQLTSAFRFLQEQKKIAHRDIKPNNILIFNTKGVKEYKIADFGEAKKAKTSKQMNTLRGTELYMSPALYQGLKQDKDDVVYDPYRSDVFSLGYCFLYAGALNIKIILEVRDVDDMSKLEKILRRYFKNKYTERFIQLMLFMLEFDESKRVDFIGLDNYLNENKF